MRIEPRAGSLEGMPLRACLVDLPTMLDEIVRHALDEAQIEIVADPHVFAGDSGAGVIITERSGEDELLRFGSLLLASPVTAILAVAESGRGATLWELWPIERTLGELSEALLLSAVQTVTPWDARLASPGRRDR